MKAVCHQTSNMVASVELGFCAMYQFRDFRHVGLRCLQLKSDSYLSRISSYIEFYRLPIPESNETTVYRTLPDRFSIILNSSYIPTDYLFHSLF